MKDGIIIQARTGSTRLHNKILLPFYGGQRIIDILIGNIKQACAGKTIVLATTDRPQDDILAEVAREAGICCYRGDEDNVLDRFIRAAEHSTLTALSVSVRTILSCVPTVSGLSSRSTMPARQIISLTVLQTAVPLSNLIWACLPS